MFIDTLPVMELFRETPFLIPTSYPETLLMECISHYKIIIYTHWNLTVLQHQTISDNMTDLKVLFSYPIVLNTRNKIQLHGWDG